MPSTNGSFDFCLAGCRLPVSPFVSACGSGGNGEDVASESVKEKIRNIIAAEDPRAPFSDQHIATALSNDAIDIARRTVAKYREAMGILPSSRRRQPFARK